MKRSPSSRVNGFPVKSGSIAAAVLGVCALHCATAAAEIIVSADPHWGPTAIITDTATKLQWLQLNNPEASTLFLSESTVAGRLATTYKGWKIATAGQVVSLFKDFDLPATLNSPVALAPIGQTPPSWYKIHTFVSDLAPDNTLSFYSVCVDIIGFCVSRPADSGAAGFTLDGGVVGLGFADVTDSEGTTAGGLPGSPGTSFGDYVVLSSPPGIGPDYTDPHWGTFLVRREPLCEEVAEQPAIIVGSDPVWGGHTIITDTVTNLQWLTFKTNELSFLGFPLSFVAWTMSGSTEYKGWNVATPAQVASLFKDFGLPITVNNQVQGVTSPRRLSDINTLINDFAAGNTYPIETPSGPVASPTLSGYTFEGNAVGFAYATLVGTPAVGFYGVFGSGVDPTSSAKGVGTFLVRQALPPPPCIAED